MGSCTQEKNWELYLRDEARRVKVDEEKLLKAEYIYRVQINLDADILNKTFSDEKMQSLSKKQRRRWTLRLRKKKKDVFNRAAIRFLGLTGVVLSDEENCALYKKLSVAFPEQFACFFRVEYVCGSFGKSACKMRRFRLV